MYPHLMQGIELVRAGRKAEALNYLRQAAHTEPLTADGWLWLAAATDDRDEYQFCVTQALQLDAQHPVAQQMWETLQRERFAEGYSDPEDYTITAMRRPSRLRRLLRALVLLVLLGGLIGGAAALAISGVVQDTARDWFLTDDDDRLLTITVGSQPSYRFRVDVPASWVPADEDSASWHATRDHLIDTFPVPEGHVSVWKQVGESFSKATRDPVYGKLIPPVRLVETDPAILRDSGVVTALTLEEIGPLPDLDSDPADLCSRMRLLEQQFQAPPDSDVIETAVAVRKQAGDCVFYAHLRLTDLAPYQITFPVTLDLAPSAERVLMLYVPVGQERYALWRLTLADSAYPGTQAAIDRVIGSLEQE